MLHARKDYNRIQDPWGRIGPDEPVFIVRAQDKIAPLVMRHWANMQRFFGGSIEMCEMVEAHADLTEKWQKEHGCRVADM